MNTETDLTSTASVSLPLESMPVETTSIPTPTDPPTPPVDSSELRDGIENRDPQQPGHYADRVVIAAPTWQPLDPKHLAMEYRTSWILFAGFAVVASIALVLVGFWWGWTSLVFLSVASGFALLIGLFLWSICAVVPRSHHAAGWMLSDRGIEIRKGIWWRHSIVIPKQRIQHSDLQQGPILRTYGLANLVIFTAGTENARVELSGLSYETAQFVRDRLLEISNESLGGV